MIPVGAAVAVGDPLMTLGPDTEPVIVADLRPDDRQALTAPVTRGAQAEGGQGVVSGVVEIRRKSSKHRRDRPVSGVVRQFSADVLDDGDYEVLISQSPDGRPGPAQGAHGNMIPVGALVEVVVRAEEQTALGWVMDVLSGTIRRGLR